MSEMEEACWGCSRECLPPGSGPVTGACYQGEDEHGIPRVACWDGQKYLGTIPILLEKCPKSIKNIEMNENNKRYSFEEINEQKVS